MNNWSKWSLLCGIVVLLICTSCKDKAPPLRIATAANLQYVMEDILEKYTASSDMPCELIIGSTGRLTSQIMSGAPYHLLLSADRLYPQQLKTANFTKGDPEVLAGGRLAVWSKRSMDNLEDIQWSDINRIAMPSPAVAPYGRAIQDYLEKQHLWEDVTEKLVYGESVSQVNQFISLQTVDLAFTSASSMLIPKIEAVGHWYKIPVDAHHPIEQTAVVISSEKGYEDQATLFIQVLQSAEAQAIFRSYHYDSVDE